ncbi:MAG: hypothetical protein WAM75_18270 [Xanthobacteraceae bacterium]
MTEEMEPFWKQITGAVLAQGDLLPKCLVPQFEPDYGTGDAEAIQDVPIGDADLIIVTQSCDLVNDKVVLVALCPIHTLDAFEETNPKFKKSTWEEVRKGRVPGLHLLGSPEAPGNNRRALVGDFGQIFSLPPKYLRLRAEQIGSRWRLASPYLEHFSQAFARYFMRVGLPSPIPPFK